MSTDPRLDDLLERWEDMLEKGQQVSPEELCRDCPELLADLKTEIRQMQWVGDLLEPGPQNAVGAGDPTQIETPRILGRYRLDELIGEGGFGQVWKGYDPELDRLVAVKVLRPERHKSVFQVARFIDEAKKVAKLRHQNIVAIHDVGRHEGFCFMVTDFIEGVDLGKRIEMRNLPTEEAVEIVAKVADALHHAHQQGIIHRDVKPQNILLDSRNEPVITDFGIAVTEDAGRDGDSDTSGTPAYMAPEQTGVGSLPVDTRTDIYSLGVVLYQLLIRRLPYETRTLAKLKQQIETTLPPSPRSVDSSLPARLDRACMRALATDPDDRWGSAEAFADELRRLYRRSWRRVSLAVVAAVAILLIATGYAAYRWGAGEPTPERSIYDDAVLFYTFDADTISEQNGQLQVRDLSGLGNHGISDAGVKVVPDGKIGGALSLEGGHLRVPTSSVNTRAEYTIVAWVYRGQRGKVHYHEKVGAVGRIYAIFQDGTGPEGGRVWVAVRGSGHSDAMTRSGSTPVDAWYFVAITRRSDGAKTGHLTMKIDDMLHSFEIGAVHRKGTGSARLEGVDALIDEFTVFDRALSDNEIQTLYEVGKVGDRELATIERPGEVSPASHSRQSDPYSDAVLHLTFDAETVSTNDTELTVRDRSGTDNHAIGSGASSLREGRINEGLEFEDGSLQFPRSFVAGRNEYTLTIWLLREKGNEFKFTELDADGGEVYALGLHGFVDIRSRNHRRRLDQQWSRTRVSPNLTPFGKWFFVAVSLRDGGVGKGILSVRVDDVHYNVDSQMADHPDAGYAELVGKGTRIDEIAIFEQALSDEEIRQIYEYGKRAKR